MKLYNLLTPFIHKVTGSRMLNFGYWLDSTFSPIDAQYSLCRLIGEVAQMSEARTIVDMGSGYSAPALYWRSCYKNIGDIICININFEQLKEGSEQTPDHGKFVNEDGYKNGNKDVAYLNANASIIPLKDRCADLVIALESAQHFRYFDKFIEESHRIIRKRGLLVIAIPVILADRKKNVGKKPSFLKQGFWHNFFNSSKLGILSLTWSSEHYHLIDIISAISNKGFTIENTNHIGDFVYQPVTDHYLKHRLQVREIILRDNTSFAARFAFKILEYVYYKSAKKMSDLAKKGLIDYVIIKARKVD